MPEEQKTPEFNDTIFEKAYEKIRIRAESSDLIAKVVTEMITEAEIECRLDDSYKEGIEKGINIINILETDWNNKKELITSGLGDWQTECN